MKPTEAAEVMPTRRQALVFAAKAWGFRLKRFFEPRRCARLSRDFSNELLPLVAESRSQLHTSTNPAEFALQAGKVQNLRVAARSLDGLRIPAGTTFSFWANVPRPVRRNGFTDGREIREGCVIPGVGGGLCQLSNALYDAALKAGFEIVERHAHTRRLPGSMAAEGRDAVIFWNYVDLRFRAAYDVRLEVRLGRTELAVSFRGLKTSEAPPREPVAPSRALPEAESCETCGVTQCFRNPAAVSLNRESVTAWLVDAWQPELDAWVAAERQARDWLFLPWDSLRWKSGPYRWNGKGFAKVRTAPWTVLRRSIISRRLATQGERRQRALLEMDEAMAAAFAKHLPPAATHLVVSQNLLPFLWMAGHLGGRTFDVLMTRLPLAELQRTLDLAAAAHPESRTLADFRGPENIVRAETEALAAARHWVTPHAAIARIACSRAVRLHWQLPSLPKRSPGNWVVFPASTLGRKGARELREVARELRFQLRLAGPCLEEPDFWNGLTTERCDTDWLAGARLVVLPAWVEHSPRRLLAAVAAGIPVIASDACGLEGIDGVTIVPRGDTAALRDAILMELGQPASVV